MLRGRGLVEPERILRNGVRRELAGKAMRAEKLIDGFKRNFERPESEGRKAARIHAHIDQLVVAKFNGIRFRLTGRDLRVARRVGLAVPARIDADRSSIDGPQHRGPFGIAGRLHFDRAVSAGKRVFDDLLDQRAKAVDRVRLFERASQGKKAPIGFFGIFGRAIAGCEAAPHAYLPVHGRDAILDDVDGAPHHGRLGKPAQIYRRWFRQRLPGKLHRAQNCRKRQRLAFRVGICRVDGNTGAAGSLPPECRAVVLVPSRVTFLRETEKA